MPERTCVVVEGDTPCDRAADARDMCSKHYMRWRAHGDPLTVIRTRKPLAERFWPKVNKDGPIPELCPELGPCWLWTAACNPLSHYGQISAGGTGPMLPAHRVAYELVVGLIPEGDTIDHLCNRRSCVNPAHLDPCTIGVNSTRGAERRKGCRRGHSWDLYTYIDPKTGRRRCRACNTEKAREYRQRVRGRTSAAADTSLHDAFPGSPGADE